MEKPSDIFFRVMEAAQERGIGQCTGNACRDSTGSSAANFNDAKSVCVMGLMGWGRAYDILSSQEEKTVEGALPIDLVHLNDLHGWSFPDFYEYLKDKEEEEEAPKPVEKPVTQV